MRAALGLDIPEALQHELKDTAPRFGPRRRHRERHLAPPTRELHAACCDLVENRLTSAGSISTRPSARQARCNGGSGRRSRPRRRRGRVGRAAAGCANRFGMRRLERVEPRERVLAHADQEVHAQPTAPQHLRELVRERARTVRRPRGRGSTPRTGRGSGRRLPAARSAASARTSCERLARCRRRQRSSRQPGRRPARKKRLRPASGSCAQPLRDSGAEQRALPDAARPVENGQPRRDQVRARSPRSRARGRRRAARRRPSPRTARAPCTGVGGAADSDAHAGTSVSASAWRPSVSTYSSSGISSTSTSRRRQNSRSSGFASGWTAHER